MKLSMKLQTFLFLACFMLSVIIIGTFSYIFYSYASRFLLERETKAAANLTSSFLTTTDDMIKDMDTVSINIGYSNLVINQLENLLPGKSNSPEFKSLVDLFVIVNGADLKVDQINVYDFNDYVVQVGIKTNNYRYDVSSFPWFDEVIELGGKKLLSEPYYTSQLSTSGSNMTPTWYLSLYRTFNNQYKKQVGIIETVKKCSSLFRPIISYQKKNEEAPSVFVYNSNGKLVYPYVKEGWQPEDNYLFIANTYRKHLGTHIHFTSEVSNESEILVSETSTYSGLTYITIRPESQILAPVTQFLILLLFIAFIMVIFCIFLSYRISKHIIGPINRLRKRMKETNLSTLGTTHTTPYPTTFVEVEELSQSFEKLGTKLKDSMNLLIETQKQELKSRSLALQSQINPHFYYNTLSSIIILAENEQSNEVVILCRNLSKIMRYITDNTSQTVTIKDELDYIQQYLYCMKVRYQSSLNYEIQVEAQLLDKKIPKLLIQPLVENALKYSSNCAPPWNINIKSVLTESSWEIQVIDSGNGFTEESIALNEERMKIATGCIGMPEIQIHGMGLLNVYLRWKLFSKNRIIFRIENTSDGHGQVSIGEQV